MCNLIIELSLSLWLLKLNIILNFLTKIQPNIMANNEEGYAELPDQEEKADDQEEKADDRC
jgi:hypothetical protein